MKKVPDAAVPEMSDAVASAVLEHLTGVEGLARDQALEVTKLFFAELGRETTEPSRGRLERVWTDWKTNR